MKISIILWIVLFAFGMQNNAKAETWNEPWQKEIIKNSEYFVLAKVMSNIDSIGTKIQVIQYFGDQKLMGEILINGFSFLELTSSSGHGLHLNFKKDQLFYFLLTKGKDGNFAIPTPTSGFALLDDDKNVYATYRHSYHQALIPQDIYEKTYTEIWNYYKKSTFDKDKIIGFINENMEKEPAGFEESEISTFFLQHAALETAYLLDLTFELDKLKKFIDFENSHSNISALQLLGNSDKQETKDFLFEYIKNKKNKNFQKVIAIWSLNKIGDEVYKKKLLKIKNSLSDEDTGFGGNIMDPRVGTHFPSPRSAVAEMKK